MNKIYHPTRMPKSCPLAQSIRLVARASHALGRRHVKHSCPRLTTLRPVLTHRSTPPLPTQAGSRSHPTRGPAVTECQPDIASQVRSVCTPNDRNDISPRVFDGTLMKGLRRWSSRVKHSSASFSCAVVAANPTRNTGVPPINRTTSAF